MIPVLDPEGPALATETVGARPRSAPRSDHPVLRDLLVLRVLRVTQNWELPITALDLDLDLDGPFSLKGTRDALRLTQRHPKDPTMAVIDP
jgi:hypothetical protein